MKLTFLFDVTCKSTQADKFVKQSKYFSIHKQKAEQLR